MSEPTEQHKTNRSPEQIVEEDHMKFAAELAHLGIDGGIDGGIESVESLLLNSKTGSVRSSALPSPAGPVARARATAPASRSARSSLEMLDLAGGDLAPSAASLGAAAEADASSPRGGGIDTAAADAAAALEAGSVAEPGTDAETWTPGDPMPHEMLRETIPDLRHFEVGTGAYKHAYARIVACSERRSLVRAHEWGSMAKNGAWQPMCGYVPQGRLEEL